MTIVYKRHYSYSNEIIIREFNQSVNVDDIIHSWEFLKCNELKESRLKGVINDLSGCELNMDLSSFKQLINYLHTNKCFSKIKLAVICDKPRNAVFPFLGEKENGLHIKPFSTIEAAVDWIMFE